MTALSYLDRQCKLGIDAVRSLRALLWCHCFACCRRFCCFDDVAEFELGRQLREIWSPLRACTGHRKCQDFGFLPEAYNPMLDGRAVLNR